MALVHEFTNEVNQQEAATLGDWCLIPEEIMLKLCHFFVVSHPVILLTSIQSHQLEKRLAFLLSLLLFRNLLGTTKS